MIRRLMWAYTCLALALFLFLAVLGWDGVPAPVSRDARLFVRVVFELLAAYVFVSVAWRMSSDPPQTWLEVGEAIRRPLILLAIAFFATLAINKACWPALVMFPMIFASHLWFAGNLGRAITATWGWTGDARKLVLMALTALCAIPWGMAYFEERLSGSWVTWDDENNLVVPVLTDHFVTDLGDVLNPPQSWWRLTVRHGHTPMIGGEFPRPASVPEEVDVYRWGWYPAAAVSFIVLGSLVRLLTQRPARGRT